MNNFSDNLKKIRKENNLSQEQLADMLGVSRQAISKWESKVSYPEMEKILMICEKFNITIDDLLHKDLKEVKGEKESKYKVNSLISNFLKQMTDSINMFFNMSFKTKVKFIFEQFLIMIIFYFLSLIVITLFDRIFQQIFNVLFVKNYNIRSIFMTVINSSISIICLISSIVIMLYVYKSRYLNYYLTFKKNSLKEDSKSDEVKNINFKKEEKIIIRDPNNSDYVILGNSIKLLSYMFKLFLLFISFFLIMTLIFLLVSLVFSFSISKSGLFFVGLLILIISSIVITILFLILSLNIIFNRKNDKKKLLYTFISSIIFMGIGIGLLLSGLTEFTFITSGNNLYRSEEKNYKMSDKLHFIASNTDINYIESNNDDIIIKYKINKACTLRETIILNEGQKVYLYSSCSNFNKMFKEFISNVNDKKILLINDDLKDVTIYSSKTNLEILKNNYNKYFNNYK